VRVLVIGGTGFLSGAVTNEACERGHSVTVVTRGSANRPAPPEGIEALHANRSDPQALRAALGGRDWDLVVDCVLYRPEDARAAVDILDGHAGRYVFISTDFVYGGEPRRYPITEDAPRNAMNAYGANKAACEDVFTEAHAANGFPAVTLRPPHILGAGGQLGTGSREGRDPWLLWRLRNHCPILLLDGGAFLIQPVHKRDIARAAFAAALSDAAPGRAYNIAGPDAVSTRRYYEMVCELLGIDLASLVVAPLPATAFVAAYPERAPFTQNRVYSTDALTRDTGYVPSITLRDALAEVIADLEARGLPSGDPPGADETLVALLHGAEDRIKGALLHAAA
jgi:nucleoside-diphosphate-sugar epimerase